MSSQRTAELKRRGQSLDLGGIGKGFASDRFMEIKKLRKDFQAIKGITVTYV